MSSFAGESRRDGSQVELFSKMSQLEYLRTIPPYARKCLETRQSSWLESLLRQNGVWVRRPCEGSAQNETFFMMILGRTYPAAGVHNTIGPLPSIVSVSVSEYEDGRFVE